MFTATNELLLRQTMATNAAGLTSLSGFEVNPSPLILNDKADFWATFDSNKDTKDEIEQNLIAACWIYPAGLYEKVADDNGNIGHSPLVRFSYEHYLFVQYGYMRQDETEAATLFDTQRLVQHDKFIAAWIELMQLYEGLRNLAGFDPSVYATMKTSPMLQVDEIQNQANCDFVSGIVGFSVRMREAITFQFKAC